MNLDEKFEKKLDKKLDSTLETEASKSSSHPESQTPNEDDAIDKLNISQKIKLAKPAPTSNVLILSLVIYTVMAVAGLEIAYWFHHSVPQIFHIPTTRLKDILLSTSVASISLILLSLGLEFFPSYRRERKIISKAIGRLSLATCILLAFASAVGEELLFRGGLQPFIGIFLSSVVFGMLHLGPNGNISFWTVWTVLAGFILGGLFFAFQSIWPCIVVHFVVNAFALVRVSLEVKRAAKLRGTKISVRV